MDQYVVEHAARYQHLVGLFDQHNASPSKSDLKKQQEEAEASTSNPDVVVAARLRPLLQGEVAAGYQEGVFSRQNTTGKIDAHELKRPLRGPPAQPTLKTSSFQVDRAFDQHASTDAIYEDLVKPLVPWAWSGGIGTMFAYGQTGSGKTYTVSSLEKLVVNTLMNGELEGNRKLYITMFELAGNSAFDLLNFRRAISVLEDSFGVVHLAGALEHPVTNPKEVFDHIESAAMFRRTETTIKNDSSSRSHAICRIRIENPDIPSAEDGLLYLIDLAGSEAARDRVQHGTDRMRETREINASLSVLKDCIRGKAEADSLLGVSSKKKPHVPFRQSTLTKVLKHIFDPAGFASCKTVVLACVNPCVLDIAASRNTLRYAEMLRVLVPKSKLPLNDPDIPMTWANDHLQDWIVNNSGTPAVSATLLAPFETGSQLLRLPAPEFESRCLKTEGVTPEQAKAFRSKLWVKHIDSQKKKAPGKDSSLKNSFLDHLQTYDRSSSKDPDPKASGIPFKDRIRPGMVVSWAPPPGFNIALSDGMNMVVIQCPVSAIKSIPNSVMRGLDLTRSPKYRQYLCSMITPGLMADSYSVDLWRQLVLDVEWMDKEVTLEYDHATRLYYIAI